MCQTDPKILGVVENQEPKVHWGALPSTLDGQQSSIKSTSPNKIRLEAVDNELLAI